MMLFKLILAVFTIFLMYFFINSCLPAPTPAPEFCPDGTYNCYEYQGEF